MRPVPEDYLFDATHTAWSVDTAEELEAWKARLIAKDVEVIETRHETIESIYFRDPNGYFIEITRQLRPLNEIDAADAQWTLEAAIALEAEEETNHLPLSRVDAIWERKAQLLEGASVGQGKSGASIRMFVPKVPEFSALVEVARGRPARPDGGRSLCRHRAALSRSLRLRE